MEFFNQVGKIALGSRVRFLADQITEDAVQIYSLYGIKMNPKWFPVFYVLSKNSDKSVSSIAEEIGHSHASVSKIVTEMEKAGVIKKISAGDKRQTLARLSDKGKKIAVKIEEQYLDVHSAIEELEQQASHDLWKALGEWEELLSQKSLLQRVIAQKKIRESTDVQIIPYQKKYQPVFKKLNEEWITTYFKMEKPDHDALDNPEGYILKRGGHIFVALLNGEPVGVCALTKRDDKKYPYELAKMAVLPKARGKNIGYLLGQAVAEKAKLLGAQKLFLESNTILKPAINLYEKLGFKKVVGPATPYERCNIQMELKLTK